MIELTDRQIQLLQAIIEEYIETAEPVGSETLDKKFNLGVSPATIRNEMVKLTESGFLKQPHTSAGRIPTSMALKVSVRNLMKPHELSVADEVVVKQQIWDYRQQLDKLLRETTRVLAQKTKLLAISTTNTGDIYYAGTAHILDMPEFFDIDMTRSLLNTLDEFDFWWKLLSQSEDDQPYHVLIGEDFGNQLLIHCGMVYIKIRTPRSEVLMGVVGPTRVDFREVIPVVRYVGNLLSEFI